jgi:hypothetical protein
MILHRFLSTNADIVGKELLGASGRRHSGFGKHTWDDVCATLVGLTELPELARPTEVGAKDHKMYLSFLLRNANKYTVPVEDIFQELPNPPLGPDGQPVREFLFMLSLVSDPLTCLQRETTHLFRLGMLKVESVDLHVLAIHIFRVSLSQSPRFSISWLTFPFRT